MVLSDGSASNRATFANPRREPSRTIVTNLLRTAVENNCAEPPFENQRGYAGCAMRDRASAAFRSDEAERSIDSAV
jgi:hypothetical protein